MEELKLITELMKRESNSEFKNNVTNNNSVQETDETIKNNLK